MTTTPNQPPLLSLAQVAEMFPVSPRTIQRWLKAKTFPPPIRPAGENGRPFWRRRDIELYIEAGSIHGFRRAKRHA